MELLIDTRGKLLERSEFLRSMVRFEGKQPLNHMIKVTVALPQNLPKDDILYNMLDLVSGNTLEDLDVYLFIQRYSNLFDYTEIFNRLVSFADFFLIDLVFDHLEESFLCHNSKYSSPYLLALLQYGDNHPKTLNGLKTMSDTLSIPVNRILEMMTSTSSHNRKEYRSHRLKNYMRGIRRAQQHYEEKTIMAFCKLCGGAGKYCHIGESYKMMAMVPCCGSPIHFKCIIDFNKLKKCPYCTTYLNCGEPDFTLEDLGTVLTRQNIRKKYNLSFETRFPKLKIKEND